MASRPNYPTADIPLGEALWKKLGGADGFAFAARRRLTDEIRALEDRVEAFWRARGPAFQGERAALVPADLRATAQEIYSTAVVLAEDQDGEHAVLLDALAALWLARRRAARDLSAILDG